MPDDTPQKMINAEKRRLQRQSFGDPFMEEMKEAEARGDLPPVRVLPAEDVFIKNERGAWQYSDKPVIVQGEKGGETPQQLAATYDERLYKNEADIDRVYSKFQKSVSLAGLNPVSDLDNMKLIDLVGAGKIQFSSPEAQAAAVDAYNDSMKTFGSASFGIKESDYDTRVKLRNLEEEFPETKHLGPEEK